MVAAGLIAGLPGVGRAGDEAPVEAAPPGVPAIDADWSSIASSPAVAEHVAANGGAVLLVAAGGGQPLLEEARLAVEQALQRSTSIERLLPPAGLGDVSQLDDAAIVHAAAAQPVTRVAIVRVYVDGDVPYAIVTAYDKTGTAVGGFSVAPGEPVQPPPQSSAGRLESVEQAVIGGGPASLTDTEEREILYTQSHRLQRSLNRTANWKLLQTRTREGTYLRGPLFYDYIGRDDLTAQYHRRAKTRKGLIASGATVLGVGGVLLAIVTPALMYTFSDYESDELPGPAIGTAIAGAVLVSVGIPLTIVGAKYRPDPITNGEAIDALNAYNAGFRAPAVPASEDEAEVEAPPQPEPLTPAASLRLGPGLTARGAGLALQGRF